MVERNDLLDRIHTALIDYDLDASVDLIFEHCSNDDLRGINDLIDCNETPDALDCNDVEPIAPVCKRVYQAFIPVQAEEATSNANCWTLGSWWPAQSCTPSTDRALCARGWGVHASQARCCMASFDNGCTLSHEVSKPTHEVETLPIGTQRVTNESDNGLICGLGTKEVDGACMSDVRCGPDTIYRDGLCMSNVTTCSGPDVFQTPGGECRSTVRAFTENHCGEGTALIHGICRSVVVKCEGSEVGILDGKCLSRVPAFSQSRCGEGTIFTGDYCALNPAFPVKCAPGTTKQGHVCVPVAGHLAEENCGAGTRLVDGKVCVALPQKPIIVTKVVESSDQCVVTRSRSNMAITLRGEGLEKRARYACDAGFKLVGDAELKCAKAANANGDIILKWQGNAPQCLAIVAKCEPLASGSLPSCFPNCAYQGFKSDAAVWADGWTKTMEAGYLGADCDGNAQCEQGRAFAGHACH